MVWLCIAATLGVILGLSIDAAQRVRNACVVLHDGKEVSRAKKEGLVSLYSAVSMLTTKGGD
jgi:hypothetical protein